MNLINWSHVFCLNSKKLIICSFQYSCSPLIFSLLKLPRAFFINISPIRFGEYDNQDKSGSRSLWAVGPETKSLIIMCQKSSYESTCRRFVIYSSAISQTRTNESSIQSHRKIRACFVKKPHFSSLTNRKAYSDLRIVWLWIQMKAKTG